jgi:hypothetical protein
MANNKIQIKRSVSNSNVTGLSNGELAFTQAGNTLHIGLPDGTGVLRIGGAMVPGTLTANQALVANATSGIDKVIVANLVPTVVWANGAAGSSGDVLTSNGVGTFWKAPVSGVSGTDTQVQFNDGGSLGADAGLTFNKTSDTLSTNTVLATSTVNAATLQVGSSIVANSSRLVIGTAVGVQVNGSIGSAGQVLTSNGSTAYWAAASTADVTGVTAGDGLTGGGTSGDLSLAVGAGNGISVSADAVAVFANSGLIANATGLHILTTGDTTLIANATGLYVNDATISIATSQLTGDVALGTQTSGNYVASVSAANGIAGAVAAAEGAAPSLYVVAGTDGGLVANSTGVFVIANNGLVANSTGLHVGQGNGVSVSADAIAVTGGSTITVNTAGVHVNNSLSIADISLSGNVTATSTVNAASHTSGAIGTGTGGTVQNTTVIFVGNNTINTVITSAGLAINGTATIANSSGVYTTGVVNAASHTSGAIGTGTGGTVQNTTVMFIGNNTINAVINSTALSIGGNSIANSTGANNAFNLGGTAASSYQLNSTLAANVATLTANNANNLGGVLAANFVQNTDSRTLSGNLNFTGANVTFGGANLTVTGTNTSFSSNVNIGGTNAAITANLTLTGASVTGTSTDLTMRNGTFSGNLVVQGSVVTVNTAQISVNDNIIQLAYNQTTTDTVDSGFFSPAGNSTAIWYSGIARIAAASTNAAPVFRVFASNTNPNTGGTIDTSANTRTGFIQAYLAPYGIGGALVSNATNITVTANSTVAVSITANSLSLSTPLSGTNGGTGKSTMTNNAILVGNSTNGYNELTLGTSGNVLQSNGTALVYDTLDGGTF